MMFGPQEMRDEVPIHFELGLAAIAFSLLMIAALFSVRAKALLISLITGLVAALTIFVALNSGDLALWQQVAFGVLGAGSALFSLYSLVSVFRGEDPA